MPYIQQKNQFVGQEHVIRKAAGILIRDRKILVEKSKNKDFYISPGGSIEKGETPKEALVRELMEEFRLEISEDQLEPFGVFFADAVNQPGMRVKMNVYLVNDWTGEPTPDNEVEKIAWINSEIPEGMPVGTIFAHEVIPQLKMRGVID